VASEQNKQELLEKLAVLVRERFGGDYQAAFRDYADRDGKVSKSGVKAMLKDAGIGSVLTRWVWVAGILAELDSDADELISWPEFACVFERREGVMPRPAPGDRESSPRRNVSPPWLGSCA